MAGQKIIDVHCHLFNAQYALKELAAISWWISTKKNTMKETQFIYRDNDYRFDVIMLW
jgi:hypothetical protein